MAEAPGYQSFPVISGDQMQLELTVRDNANAVVDLTGGSGRFAMARNPRGTIIIDSDASPANATITVVDAANGRVDVTVTDENTEALVGDYYWAMKWTDNTGREALIAHGYISFEANLI
jgi:hypothetical protein